MSKGFTDEYISSLDIASYREIYKHLKRIEARNNMTLTSIISVAFGADKKTSSSFMNSLGRWLPKEESLEGSNKQGTGNKTANANDQQAFENLVRQGI